MKYHNAVIRLEAPNGSTKVVKFGNMCSAINDEKTSLLCSNCPLKEYKWGNTTASESCSALAMNDPEKFYKLSGFKVISVSEGYDAKDTEKPKPPTRKGILEAAERCVCGDRDQQYGSPEASFEAIADLWGSYLWNKHDLGHKGLGKNFISPEDVAAMMVLFKMARVATGSYKADSWIDAAGYAACGGEIGGNKQ